MNYLKIDFKAFILLTLTFILMTVIGTLTHELGHYVVAKYLGREAGISYNSVSHRDDALNDYLKGVYKNYAYEIKNNLDFPEKEKYQKAIQKYQADKFWIALGGPLQTMLTGSIGLILLLVYRHKYITAHRVSLTGWALIFMALFWLRQVANLFVAGMLFLMEGQPTLRGDEIGLALHLDLNMWTILMITGLLGLAVLFTVLKLLPKTILLTFLLSGLTGGLLGFYLWLVKYGQYIMP